MYTALVRNDRLRGTPLQEVVTHILKLVPDYRIALDNTDIDPVRDLDSMFMASARPQYIQHTFLAVRHRMSDADMQERLARRFGDGLAWSDYNGIPIRDLIPENEHYQDPRKILLRPGMAVLTRPEFLGELTRNLPKDSDARLSEGRATLLDSIAQIEDAADPETLALVSAMDIRVFIPGLGPRTFEGIALSVTDAANPHIKIDLKFPKEEDATGFADACPSLKNRIISGQKNFMVRNMASNYLDRVTCVANETYVTVEATYTSEEIRSVLGLASMVVPQPMVLSKLPKPPPLPADAGSDPADAGSDDVGGDETITSE